MRAFFRSDGPHGCGRSATEPLMTPFTLTLSPRFVVSVLRDSLAGERGQISVAPLTTRHTERRLWRSVR